MDNIVKVMRVAEGTTIITRGFHQRLVSNRKYCYLVTYENTEEIICERELKKRFTKPDGSPIDPEKEVFYYENRKIKENF